MRARGLFVALVAGAAFVPSLPQAASAEGPVVVELDSPVGRGAMVPGNARLLDTRSGSATVDGVGVGAGRVAADGFIEIPTSGRLDIRADAAALVLNLTIVQPGAAGYATAYVCTEGRNGTSSVNFAAAEDIANTVVLPGDRGALCVYTSAAAHVVVDYTAQLIDQADYRSDVRRVVDTRSDIGLSKATPRAFVPLPHIDVGDPRRSLLLNVVVTESAAPGWLWIGDCDRDNFVAAGVGPGVSTVNFAAGATRANLALAGGTAQCVYTSTDVEVVIDIVGSVDVSGTDRQ